MKKIIALILALILATGAVGLALADDLLILDNPTLIEWSATCTALQLVMQSQNLPVDLCSDNGSIGYYEKNIRKGSNGERVADGGTYSQKKTYMLGMGAGVDREDLWYVTMTYSTDTNIDECYNNVACMLLAFEDIHALLNGSEDEKALLEDILNRLVLQSGSVGFQYNGKVLMRKDIGQQFIIGVDSVAFYEAFYAGSLTEYYNLDQ